MIPFYNTMSGTTDGSTDPIQSSIRKQHSRFLPARRNAVETSILLILMVCALICTLTTAQKSIAGQADVIDAGAVLLDDGRYRIEVTLTHADTGWEHYADRWDILAEDGSVLGIRELAHPHVNEQPFTRSLTLTLPAGTKSVTVRANDSVHGAGGQSFKLQIPLPQALDQ